MSQLSPKLYLFGRNYKDADWLAAIPDRNETVQVVLRGEQPKERGAETRRSRECRDDPAVRQGLESNAAERDRRADRRSHQRSQEHLRSVTAARRPLRLPRELRRAGGGPGDTGIPSAITTLIDEAGKALAVPNCEEYYNKLMSPNFKKVTSKKALEALINSCKTSLGTRELLVATIRIVKDLVPTFEFDGQKAVYDVSGQGLPFDRFVIEQVDRKWYIAE